MVERHKNLTFLTKCGRLKMICSAKRKEKGENKWKRKENKTKKYSKNIGDLI